jgi:outer membrane immunogenic protein
MASPAADIPSAPTAGTSITVGTIARLAGRVSFVTITARHGAKISTPAITVALLSLNRIGWLIRSISKLPDRGISLKKILLGAAALVAISAVSASAADMAPAYTKAPPPVVAPVYNWTGFYVGGNIGGGWGHATDPVYFQATGFPTPLLTENGSTSPSGVLGGAQAGYNWQTSNLVLGIETDIQGSGISATAITPGLLSTCGVPCSVTETDKLTWFGTTRGRIGYGWTNWMVYATGGAAYGGVNTSGVENFVGGVTPQQQSQQLLTSTTTTRVGWTAGAGVEGRFAGQWSWKLEYLYMDFGTNNYAFPDAPPLAPGTITQSLHLTSNVVRVGVNYHFGAPVVAQY